MVRFIIRYNNGTAGAIDVDLTLAQARKVLADIESDGWIRFGLDDILFVHSVSRLTIKEVKSTELEPGAITLDKMEITDGSRPQ